MTLGIDNGNSTHMQTWRRDNFEAMIGAAPLPRDAQIRNAAALLRAVWNLRKSHLRSGDLLRARAYSPIVSGKIAELRKLKGDMR